MGHTLNTAVFIVILLLLDAYVLNGLSGLSAKWRLFHKRSFPVAYFAFSALLILGILLVIYIKVGLLFRLAFIIFFFLVLVFKVSYLPFLLLDDLRRLIVFLKSHSKKPVLQQHTAPARDAIPRSEFLMKAGLLAGAIPLAAITLNMKSGLYDYQVKRLTLYLPNLPAAFDGMRLGQISDIHSGSFFNETAVSGGIDMLMREKADLIFFTGDLVNKKSDEMHGYQDVFGKVKAPLGVFSSLGNHDYGDYCDWPNEAAKRKNLIDLITTHKNMGWNLLLNQNHRLKVNGEEIGILGCENWGALSRFKKYGNMAQTVKNTGDLPVNLLLSHDPSHWRAQVLPEYPQIDVMFSGHTHGMQLGIQTENFQWSPVEYIYNEWAGLYHQGQQQLYVNVGYGFLGIKGRVGILPEITIFELKSATNPLLKSN